MKRLFDVVVSAALLILLWPVMLVIAVLVRKQLGRPILFLHTRPGLNGKPFQLLKFRSMRNLSDIQTTGDPLADDLARLTPFSRWLRASSLDELPSLLNVLKGEMSLVGPRPLEMSYLPLYTPEQARRHEVRPGVTGWAQVNGRNAVTWEKRFQMDVWYVDNRSLALDLKILWLTVLKVIRRADTTPADGELMSSFQGTPQQQPESGDRTR